jgi:hypothetical protein
MELVMELGRIKVCSFLFFSFPINLNIIKYKGGVIHSLNFFPSSVNREYLANALLARYIIGTAQKSVCHCPLGTEVLLAQFRTAVRARFTFEFSIFFINICIFTPLVIFFVFASYSTQQWNDYLMLLF